MHSTIKLLRVIGSPFAPGVSESPANDEEASDLYSLAVKNKIGLLYLEALKRQGKLDKLEVEYKEGYARYLATQETAVRISQALSSIGTRHAIYKFVKAYPSTPSDVDVLFLCSRDEYKRATDTLLAEEYYKIAETPSQILSYDLRDGREGLAERDVGKKEGGIYYIDLYKEAASSHIIYMDKTKLDKHIIRVELTGGPVMTLNTAADLAVTLVHSILPEQLYTLGDYYTTLFLLSSMKSEGMGDFLDIVKENNIGLAVKSSIGITATLHQIAHGSIPREVDFVLAGLHGKASAKVKEDNANPPYRYSLWMMTRVLLEKMREGKTSRSVIRQIIAMANLKLAKSVANELLSRRRRETY